MSKAVVGNVGNVTDVASSLLAVRSSKFEPFFARVFGAGKRRLGMLSTSVAFIVVGVVGIRLASLVCGRSVVRQFQVVSIQETHK